VHKAKFILMEGEKVSGEGVISQALLVHQISE